MGCHFNRNACFMVDPYVFQHSPKPKTILVRHDSTCLRFKYLCPGSLQLQWQVRLDHLRPLRPLPDSVSGWWEAGRKQGCCCCSQPHSCSFSIFFFVCFGNSFACRATLHCGALRVSHWVKMVKYSFQGGVIKQVCQWLPPPLHMGTRSVYNAAICSISRQCWLCRAKGWCQT